MKSKTLDNLKQKNQPKKQTNKTKNQINSKKADKYNMQHLLYVCRIKRHKQGRLI